MKKVLKIFVILSYIILIVSVVSNTLVYADVIDPDTFRPSDETAPTAVTSKAGTILGLLQVVSIVISVIVIIILGIKYLAGSVEQKADYKKSMIPYVVGVVLLVLSTSIVKGINDLVTQSLPTK